MLCLVGPINTNVEMLTALSTHRADIRIHHAHVHVRCNGIYRKCYYVVICCERHDCYVKMYQTHDKVMFVEQSRAESDRRRLAVRCLTNILYSPFTYGRLTWFSTFYATPNVHFRDGNRSTVSICTLCTVYTHSAHSITRHSTQWWNATKEMAINQSVNER